MIKKEEYRILEEVNGTDVKYYPQHRVWLIFPFLRFWTYYYCDSDCPLPSTRKDFGNFICEKLDADLDMFGEDMDLHSCSETKCFFFHTKSSAINFLKLKPPHYISCTYTKITPVEV